MKRICFLISSISNAGGSERVCTEIANQLSLSGYRVTILSVFGDCPYFGLEADIQVIPVYAKKRTVKIQLAFLPVKLRLQFLKLRPDIVVNVDSALFLFSYLASARLNLANITWEHFNYHRAASGVRAISRKVAAHRSSAIVVLTQADARAWKESLKCRAPVIVIHNPTPFAVEKQAYKSQNIVLSVGRFTSQKGFDTLLSAWSMLKRKETSSNWELHLVGSGELKSKLEETVKQYGLSQSVHMFPATPHIERHYSQAAIYCLSSRFEGFPMVLLEAQSFGIPVVSFDCQTGPAEIITNGSGILVKDGDMHALSSALLNLMNDDAMRKEMSKRAFVNAEQFNVNKIAGEWQAMLNTLLTK